MSGFGAARSGRPIGFAAAVVVGWAVMRTITYEAPWPLVAADLPVATKSAAAPADANPKPTPRAPAGPIQVANAPIVPIFAAEPPALQPLHWREAPLPDRAPFERGRAAAGHAAGWMAAMAAVPMLASVGQWMSRQPPGQSATPAVPGTPESTATPSRWRVDAWALLREGGLPRTPAGTGAGVLGGSQIGAVLAYRLAPGTRGEPALYVRASQALAGGQRPELAAGLRMRPLAALPVTAHAELRLDRAGRDARIRPAAFLAGGVDDRPLPAGFALSGYAQAGYVGGEGATAFADGRLVADREVARFRLGALLAGAGVWGGAQEGAARVDVGPSAQWRTTLAGAPVRLSADYRLRVAGDALPASGAALTLSTGF